MKKKAIIFGVTGQDGSHLADLLLSKRYHVIGVSRRSSTISTERVDHLLNIESFEMVQGDITDTHSVLSIFKKYADVDEVYNLAAQSHVGTSFTQPALTWDITGKGCLNILQSMVDIGIDAKFYQASSSEMFGKNYDVKNGKKYQGEETKFMPQSPYAIAKCAAHYMTSLYREAYNIHASAGILFNHEGPRRGENFVTRKITKWIGEFEGWRQKRPGLLDTHSDENYIISKHYPNVHGINTVGDRFPKLRLGNLEAFRDWGYAGDYVEAMWMMLQQDSPGDYVICTGKTHTIREFLDVAFNSVDYPNWGKVVVQDPEFYRPAEVDFLCGDNTKAQQKLGWKPKHNFEDLVKMMVDHDVS